ncbi:hypothetical protein ScPMuIL_017291 [Solemya velum]
MVSQPASGFLGQRALGTDTAPSNHLSLLRSSSTQWKALPGPEYCPTGMLIPGRGETVRARTHSAIYGVLHLKFLDFNDFEEVSTAQSVIRMAVSHENDLPLSANVDCINVHHFILDLTCNLEERTFSGCVIIFLEPVKDQHHKDNIEEEHVESSDSLDISGEHCMKSHESLLDTGSCVLSSDWTEGGRLHVGKGSTVSGTCSGLKPHDVESVSVLREGNNETMNSARRVLYDRSEKFDSEAGIAVDNGSDIVSYRSTESQTQYPTFRNQFEPSVSEIDTEHSTSSQDEDSLQTGETTNDFILVLDSSEIEIFSVEEVAMDNDMENDCLPEPKSIMKKCCGGNMNLDVFKTVEELGCIVEKNCIRIWKKRCKSANLFSTIVRVNYSTTPKGKSLKWTLDQDGSLSVFTHGHWLNNRSLFPSQDVSVSMATWEAIIRVEKSLTVLMSGDDHPVVSVDTGSSGILSFYYRTGMSMPASTLALAVGRWEHTVVSRGDDNKVLPCRLFMPAALEDLAVSEIGDYLPRCLSAAFDLLGPHPFSRLDVLLVPSSFDSLGMASPSLVFLSQSVLTGDSSLCVRLAHEISHSWFGLAIGPLDWTEEWLTEGFCTYSEGYIHATAMGWAGELCRDHAELRDVLRHRTLLSEIQNTDVQLQVLRPSKDEDMFCEKTTEDGVKYIKNGMNPDKKFTQVHYLKGYFLLRYLEETVGCGEFHKFLQGYVKEFHGKLITSQDVFSCFLSMFPELRNKGISEDVLTRDWLDEAGVPKKIEKFETSQNNELAVAVYKQLEQCRSTYCRKKTHKRRKFEIDGLVKLEPDQLLVFLDLLLDENDGQIPVQLLKALKSSYNLTSANAEIQHRWCELVVKHKFLQCYSDVQAFLVNHQALGIYLYGEMILSGSQKQKQLAVDCFHSIEQDMEEGLYTTVHAMLFGDGEP